MLEIRRNSHKRGSRPHRAPGSLVRVVKRVIIVTGIFVGIATSYVWMGQHEFGPSLDTTYVKRESSAQAAAATLPRAHPKVTIEFFAARVSPGAKTSLTIRTDPGLDCSIKIQYGKEKTLAISPGLIPKKTGADGVASWSWTVQPTMPVGKWPTTVICGEPDNQGRATKNLIVSAPAP